MEHTESKPQHCAALLCTLLLASSAWAADDTVTSALNSEPGASDSGLSKDRLPILVARCLNNRINRQAR